ncbi:hypothetical protein PENTCL1PPCAC_11952, partial [Pristionchus entomophagus]
AQPLATRAKFSHKKHTSTLQYRPSYPSHPYQPRQANQWQQRAIYPVPPRVPVSFLPSFNPHIPPPPVHYIGPMFSSVPPFPFPPIGGTRSTPHMALPTLTPPISPPNSQMDGLGVEMKTEGPMAGRNSNSMLIPVQSEIAAILKMLKADVKEIKTEQALEYPPISLISNKRGATSLTRNEEKRLLSTRYSSAVRDLLSKRVCNDCGIPLEKITGDLYNEHMSRHIKEKLGSLKKKEAKSRAFYCSAKVRSPLIKILIVMRPSNGGATSHVHWSDYQTGCDSMMNSIKILVLRIAGPYYHFCVIFLPSSG